MSKLIGIFAVFAIATGSVFAGLEMPCKKMEYAQLKDSTKAELNAEYCEDLVKASFNDSIKETHRTSEEFATRSGAQISCLEAANAAEAMMKKKFKSSPKCKTP